eukprot:SAG31_NODE_20124_length_583_cov_0.896694_1_plen_49_part_10
MNVLEQTATISESSQTHDFVFTAQSGMRYNVHVRVVGTTTQQSRTMLYV